VKFINLNKNHSIWGGFVASTANAFMVASMAVVLAWQLYANVLIPEG